MKIETYVKMAVYETCDFHSATGYQDEMYLTLEHNANNKHAPWQA
jgi:hypothetical protein